MFECLDNYNHILVTGPQRSGTRIASKMIAQDLGYMYVDEKDFNVHDANLFKEILDTKSKVVVQCPTMCYIIDEFSGKDVLVVMMLRDLDDIYASEKRINWNFGVYLELMNYGYSSRKARSFRLRGGHVAPIKYAHWLVAQRHLIPNYLELRYEDLSEHNLWVPKEQRLHFAPDQTEVRH